MKSFLQVLKEEDEGKKPVVMAFGRMNPPTTGHLKLIDKVREVANKQKAKHTVILSHSQDSKKNPLSAEQKVKHLKRYSPGTHFEASSKETPTILHHAARLHAAGHDHLTVVAGSDRVKEMHDLLHKYNGVKGRHGHYNFKKISVVSAGHRDPDAEGEEGMSGTKMREHAKNKDFHEFRKGVPHHVSDAHVKELMKDTRKGMGLHEQVDRGQFRAIFVTGGPGSGKDIIIREAIAEARAVELNTIQAFDYLQDKVRLSERTGDLRREAIRNRSPLVINGPADDHDRIMTIKEELEELGYETMMVFVNTTNEVSKERNEKLNRMISESLRFDKWQESQKFHDNFAQQFKTMLSFDNSPTYREIEQQITETYHNINDFLDDKEYNDIAFSWLENHNKLNINETFKHLFKEKNDVKKDSKSIQAKTFGKYNPGFKVAGPADASPDNNRKGLRFGQTDSIKGDTFPRKNPNGNTIAGGAGAGAYAATEETKPTLKISAKEKVPNFQKDNNIVKTGKSKTSGNPVTGGRNTVGSGPGQTFSDRSGLQMGLGETKRFSAFRKQVTKEAIDDPGLGDPGLGGVAGGTSNKEGMQMYADRDQKMKMAGIQINKKKKGAK
jgi:cytidyltransferase-like protein